MHMKCSPRVSHVKTDLLDVLLLPKQPGRDDLENAQTTVTAKSTFHSSHHTLHLIAINDNAEQQNTCSGLPGFHNPRQD